VMQTCPPGHDKLLPSSQKTHYCENCFRPVSHWHFTWINRIAL